MALHGVLDTRLSTSLIEYSSLTLVSKIKRLMWPLKTVKTSCAIAGKRVAQSANAPFIIAPVILDIQGCTSSIRCYSSETLSRWCR